MWLKVDGLYIPQQQLNLRYDHPLSFCLCFINWLGQKKKKTLVAIVSILDLLNVFSGW